jgi:predicted nucleic acid-binding protein
MGINGDKPCFVLDASVLIGHLNHNLDLFTFLKVQGECEIFTPVISEIETLSKPCMTREEETEVRALLRCFKRVEIDDAICDLTVQIRRTKKLLLPDALIAVSAISLNATVLSNDPHLQDYLRDGYKARRVP